MTAPEAYIVLDTETTGLSASDRVIELAAIKVVRGEIVDRRNQLFDPGRSLPPFITGLTHITDDMLRGKPPIAQVLPRFLAFVDGLPVVGHNIQFDIGMLRREAERAGIPFRLAVAADTVTMSRRLLPDVPSHSLGALVDLLHLECQPAHRALADVYATQALYQYLLALEAARPAPSHKKKG